MLLLAVHNLREPASAKVPFSMVSECPLQSALPCCVPCILSLLSSSFTRRRSSYWTVFPRSYTPRRFVAGMLVAPHIMRRSKHWHVPKAEFSFAYHRQILPTSGIKSSSLWEVRRTTSIDCAWCMMEAAVPI